MINLSLCLIVKDENHYLPEWIDYHILLGVEHFWIYDNDSSLPVTETLKSYIQSGWVTVHTIHGNSMQMYAYDHCIQQYQSVSKWIGFIDTDEFIVLHQNTHLNEFLSHYELYGGLAISSLFFGNGGNRKRPKGGQLLGFQYRTPEQLSYNRLVKMIIQPDKVMYPVSPHSFLFKEGFYCVNESGLRVDAQQFPCHVEKVQLNHYFTRSDEEWYTKITRGRGDAGNPYSDERWKKINHFSTIKDTSALELIAKLFPDVHKSEATSSHFFEHLPAKLHEKSMGIKPPVLTGKYETQTVTPRIEFSNYLREINNGLALLDSGQFLLAKTFYADQINKYPLDVIRFTNYAAVCIQSGNPQEAWPALAQAWRLAPQSLYVLLCMIDYFYAIENFEQVEKTCVLAAAQGDLESEVMATLAISQWKLGKIQEAIETSKPLMSQLKEMDKKRPIFKELEKIFPYE